MLILNEKKENTEYHGQVCSKQASPIFFLFGKVKHFSENSNLTNLVNVQHLHEKGKSIMYF